MLLPELLLIIQLLYVELGYKPFITSGYREPTHSLERHKHKLGTHVKGIAIDLRCRSDCRKIVRAAQKVGFTGIGIYDKHIHLDIREHPAIWRGKSQ